MKAFVLESTAPVESNPLLLTERPRPQPLENELLVRIIACAICRTDLHIVEGDLPMRARL